MRERFIPRVLSAAPQSLLDDAGLIDPAKAAARMGLREKPGAEADRSVPIGTIETAIWDALAKALDRPLWQLLAERFGTGAPGNTVRAAIPVYVGGGWYQPENDLAALDAEIQRNLAAGYTHMKIKVGGVAIDDDLRRIDLALRRLSSPDHLAVDANAALSPERAHATARRLAPLGLRWFEEPCAPTDFATFAELARDYTPALGTGENLFCLQDVENLMRFGGFRLDRDFLQVDPPQAFGLAAYAAMVARVESLGGNRARIMPHGGNMMSFAVTAGLGLGSCEAYPGVFGAFGGYADGMFVTNGTLNLPDAPGIGFERQPQLIALMRALAA